MANIPMSDLLSKVAGLLRGGSGAVPSAPPTRENEDAAVSLVVAQAPVMRCNSQDADAAARRALASPERWMSVLEDTPCAHMRQKRLVDIAIVGSNNAGSWSLDEATAASTSPQRMAPGSQCHNVNDIPSCARWSRSQVGNLQEQLRAGTRYVDLRVMYDTGVSECAGEVSQDRHCWRTWNNLVGRAVDQELASIANFLRDDLAVDGGGEIVVLDLRIENFEASNVENTNQRLLVLLDTVNTALGEYAFEHRTGSHSREWWLVEIKSIIDSDRRLIILLDPVVTSSYTLNHFNGFMNTEYGPDPADQSQSTFRRQLVNRLKTKCTMRPNLAGTVSPPCTGQIWSAASTPATPACCDGQTLLSDQRSYQTTYHNAYIGDHPYRDYTGISNAGSNRVRQNARRPLLQLNLAMAKEWSAFPVWSPYSETAYTSDQVEVHSLLDAARRFNPNITDFFYNISLQDPPVAVFGNILMADGLAGNASEPGSQILLEIAARFSAGGPPLETIAVVPRVTTPEPISEHPHNRSLGFGFWLVAVGTAVVVGLLVSFCTFGIWCKCSCFNKKDDMDGSQPQDGEAFGSFMNIFKYLPGQKEKEKKRTLNRQTTRKSISAGQQDPGDLSLTSKEAKKKRKTLMRAATTDIEMQSQLDDKPDKKKERRKSRKTVGRAGTAPNFPDSGDEDIRSSSKPQRMTTIDSVSRASLGARPSTGPGGSPPMRASQQNPRSSQQQSSRRLPSASGPPGPLSRQSQAPGGQRRTVVTGGVLSNIPVAD